jgi:hypothetical protein
MTGKKRQGRLKGAAWLVGFEFSMAAQRKISFLERRAGKGNLTPMQHSTSAGWNFRKSMKVRSVSRLFVSGFR